MTTPYRTDLDALRETKETLERELNATKTREQQLEGELRGIDERIKARTRLPMLENVRVASPCSADWNEMLGDDRVRFCTSCEKNVFNLSAMSREEAERLLAERMNGELCVRFYQRADGTLMTSDCPVGVTKKRRKLAILAAAGAGAMALAATSFMTKMGKPAGPVMGEMTVAPPPPAVMGSIAAPVDTVPPVQPTSPMPHANPPATPTHAPAIMGKPMMGRRAR